ncbi:MAG: type 1 glutamine amidotransferase domain-containing protein [Planctomycetota bacterium]
MATHLVVVTSHGTLAGERNGTYAPELTHAIHEFTKAGDTFDIASPKGGAAPLYGEDIEDGINREILAMDLVESSLRSTKRLADIDPSGYESVFYPGGYGLLFDLAEDEISASIASHVFESGGVIGSVCHGPVGLLPVRLSDGSSLLESREVTGFTREEEIDYGTIDKIPYLLEERLTRAARQYSKVAPWREFVVTDQRVISGQNPQSAGLVARSMIKQMA